MLKKIAFAALGSAAILAATMVPAIAQERGGVINIATIGELATLDPMMATNDLVGMVTHHFFETLYTFDANWNVTPLLAAALPEVSEDGKVHTIKLRQGVTFHDGSDMTSADVLPSLERWVSIASRGQMVAANLDKIEALDDYTIRITLKQPMASLNALLAFNNSAAVILPSENIAETLTEYVGTGPYKLKERRVDQYIQLVRFEEYSFREGEPDGLGGARKQYLDEIRFVPVPDANTRVEGAIAGQYDYADVLPVEAYDRLVGQSKTEPVLLNSFGWPTFIMNSKEGVLANLGMRKAVLAAFNSEDMLAAAFGKPEFYKVDGAMYPEGYPWRNEEGVEAYNQGNPEAAKALAQAAGYDGSPIRILTSRQYEFHFKMAQVAAEYLKLAGFTVELGVFDWATLVQRRAEPGLWDLFITHSPFLPDPVLIAPLPASYPGWWTSEKKEELLSALNTEVSMEKRVAVWSELQKLIYEEVPFYKVGDFSALSAKAPKVEGFTPSALPYFWNVYLKQ